LERERTSTGVPSFLVILASPNSCSKADIVVRGEGTCGELRERGVYKEGEGDYVRSVADR
jgi:hypothetical protein